MKLPKDFDPNQPKRNWKRFQRISIDKKNISIKMRQAETATTKHAHSFLIKRIDSLITSRQAIVLWLVGVGIIMAGVTLQIIWADHTVTHDAPAKGGTYAEGVVGTLDSLNPLYASSSAEVSASRLMFSSLYKYDPTGRLSPDLAESAVPNEKGTEYTITIRDDAKWQDGEPLTAKDVEYTVNLMKNPESRVRSSLRANWRDVNVEMVDKTTLKFSLPAPYAAFAHALNFPVVPEHILSRTPVSALREAPFSLSPIGSGPFIAKLLQTVDMSSGRKVVYMEANQDYYGESPMLSRFELHTYGSDDNLLRALETGEVTAAANISAKQATKLDKSKFVAKSTPINNGVYALFNNTHPILKSQKVRKAIRYAIDTDAIRQAIGGDVQALELPFLNGQLDDENLPTVPKTDTSEAIKLLETDGWKSTDTFRKKGEQTLEVTITVTKNPQYQKVADLIRDQLVSIGIDAKVKVIDSKSLSTNFIQNVLQARNYDMLVYELPIGADPDVYAYWHSSQLGVSGYNFSNYSNKTADAALATARDRLDPMLRNAKYTDFASQWVDDAPAVGLYQQDLVYARTLSARAIGDDARFVGATDRYANIAHWSVAEQRVYKTP